MSRIITFSRQFPAYHLRKGEQTYFVEKIWSGLDQKEIIPFIQDLYSSNDWNYRKYDPKHHTIRSGKRWKVGDMFSPRIWSDRPYNSKMITIAPDIEVKKIWDFAIIGNDYILNQRVLNFVELKAIAQNDGLFVDDLELWFAKEKSFSGQIICWNDKIEY